MMNDNLNFDRATWKIDFGDKEYEIDHILAGYHFNKSKLVFWEYVSEELKKKNIQTPDFYVECDLGELLYQTLYTSMYSDVKTAALFYEKLDTERKSLEHNYKKKLCLEEMLFFLGSGMSNKILVNCGERKTNHPPLNMAQQKMLNETISKFNENERINDMSIKEKEYDSYADTMIHKRNIENVMLPLIEALQERMKNHDNSKLSYPEKEGYDKHIPELKKHKYGSSEYVKAREAMAKDCLDHHWEVNRHHPEHFPRMLRDMNLVDFFEYFCDCYASSLVSDTGFDKGVEINAKKHELPDTMVEIFKNTVRDFF